jgi:hypothetical protein
VAVLLAILMRTDIKTCGTNEMYVPRSKLAKYFALIILCSVIIGLARISDIGDDYKMIYYIYPGLLIFASVIGLAVSPTGKKVLQKFQR